MSYLKRHPYHYASLIKLLPPLPGAAFFLENESKNN